MDLSVDGTTVTGTWNEITSADGYYRGARYSGAIQLLVEPSGHRMAGQWVGYGRSFDVNTGPCAAGLRRVPGLPRFVWHVSNRAESHC